MRRSGSEQSERLNTVIRKIPTLLGQKDIVVPSVILIWDGSLSPGYGKIGSKARDAISLMAQSEGLFLDPVYTAKTFAGLLDAEPAGYLLTLSETKSLLARFPIFWTNTACR